MQSKRSKRSRIRAAKVTAGHGHKKKNRGAGHRGGRGNAGGGKRGDFKLMKLKKELGKYGFKSLKTRPNIINLQGLQNKLPLFLDNKKITKVKDTYNINLNDLGYQKLLSKGKVKTKLSIKVNQATKSAITKVQSAGGKVELLQQKAGPEQK